MNRIEWEFAFVVLFTMAILSLVCGICSAREAIREDAVEISAVGYWVGGTSETEGWLRLEVDDWTLYGINIGKDITDNWNINSDLLFGSADVHGGGTVPGGSPVQEKGDIDAFWWMVNVDYNFLTEPITPFVTGGIGLACYSAEIEARNLDTGATVRASDDSTEFLWNLGAGGRWDITEHVFVKALYKITWDEDEDWDGLAVHVGYMF